MTSRVKITQEHLYSTELIETDCPDTKVAGK